MSKIVPKAEGGSSVKIEKPVKIKTEGDVNINGKRVAEGATNSSRNAKRPQTLYGDVVHIPVGPEAQDFAAHKGLLCEHSTYFKERLNQNQDTKSVERFKMLKSESPLIFHHFNEWLYTSRLSITEWQTFLSVYVFAEKYGIPRFQNAIIDAMITFCQEKHTVPPNRSIDGPWRKVAETSPLRRFLIEVFARYADIEQKFQNIERPHLPPRFIAGVARALYGRTHTARNKDTTFWKQRCDWHLHDNAEQCGGSVKKESVSTRKKSNSSKKKNPSGHKKKHAPRKAESTTDVKK